VPIAKIVVGLNVYLDDLTFSDAKPSIVKGTKGDDRLAGSQGGELIAGKGGNDKIKAKGGDDTIDAGKGNDKVNGRDGNDSIIGGEGADKLTGGPGQDSFVMGALGWVDKLKDFDPFDDTIVLPKAVFAAPGLFTNGTQLSPLAFRVGAAAADPDDRIIYNFNTGELSYDIDGNGAIAPIVFAKLPVGLALTEKDFLLA
jgi:Ca2+-binding RTX toxin-like protein